MCQKHAKNNRFWQISARMALLYACIPGKFALIHHVISTPHRKIAPNAHTRPGKFTRFVTIEPDTQTGTHVRAQAYILHAVPWPSTAPIVYNHH
jgi:hypothetical protein